MKIFTDLRLPQSGSLADFARRLTQAWRDIAEQVNAVSEGAISANHNALTAAPTTGAYQQGDFVRNKEPVELGAPGAKYVVHGWQCVVSGEPGTWVECRYLTGN